jgi:hypothetical protein
MLDNKKAQVGDTMTWVVATLVIIVVLGILIFATYSVSNKSIVFIDDKEKDFIATKSITNFLRNDNNVKLIEGKNYDVFEEKMKKMLNNIPEGLIMVGGHENIIKTIWGFKLIEDEKVKFMILCNKVTDIQRANYMETNLKFNEKTKLKFTLNPCGK